MAAPVLLLEDSPDLLLLEKMWIEKKCQCRALTAHNYEEIKALGDLALSCSVAILDINLGADQPSGVDVYHWLRDHGFEKPVIFLTGHGNQFPPAAEAAKIGDARILLKPVNPDELVKIVKGIHEAIH